MQWIYRLAHLMVFWNIQEGPGIYKSRIIIRTPESLEKANYEYSKGKDVCIVDLLDMGEATDPIILDYKDCHVCTSEQDFSGVNI